MWGLVDDGRLGIRKLKNVKYAGKNKYTNVP